MGVDQILAVKAAPSGASGMQRTRADWVSTRQAADAPARTA